MLAPNKIPLLLFGLLTRAVKCSGELSGGSSFGWVVISGNQTSSSPAATMSFNSGEHLLEWTPEKFTVHSYRSTFMEFDTATLAMIAEAPMHIRGFLDVGTLAAKGTSDWYLHSLEGFDGGGDGWSDPRTSTCGASADLFLGGHCKFGGKASTGRVYSDLPPHAFMKITARVHYFDKWMGEAVMMSVDNTPQWVGEYKWCSQPVLSHCLRVGVDSCGKDRPDK